MTQCESVQNGDDIDLTEKDNSVDVSKFQVNGESCKEIEKEKTRNTLQEQNEKQSQSDIDMISNVTTESKVECKLAASLTTTNINSNTEEQNQHEKPEDSVSHTGEKDERVEKNLEISETIQNSQDEWELLDDDMIESMNLFHDEVKSNN